MRFAADRMLGKLAKWLRILGYDTVYSRSLDNADFLRLANEGRVLLSRNTGLIGRTDLDQVIFVAADDPKEQLRNVIRRLGLHPDPDKFFCRCTVCNGLLDPVEPEDVVGRVPEHIWTQHHTFSECKACGKVYWEGTHIQRSRLEIQRLLEV
jgi:uncharacterized protein with PIN domain